MTTGYDSPVGTAGVIAANPRRPLAVIPLNTGVVDSSTTYRWSSSSGQRSVASPGNGTNEYYIVTDSSAQGTRYTQGTGTIAQQTPSASAGRISAAAHRTVNIFDGRLFISTGSSTGGPGLALVDPSGSGLPTGSTSSAFSLTVQGFCTTAGGGPEQFVLLDQNPGVGYSGTNLDTAYIADSGLGLQKWTFDGSSWNLLYTTKPTDNAAGGLWGLDFGGVDPSGDNVLYVTNVGSGVAAATLGNSLYKVTDGGTALTEVYTKLADSPTNTYFRGVAAIPEPASLGLLGLASLGLMRRRTKTHA